MSLQIWFRSCSACETKTWKQQKTPDSTTTAAYYCFIHLHEYRSKLHLHNRYFSIVLFQTSTSKQVCWVMNSDLKCKYIKIKSQLYNIPKPAGKNVTSGQENYKLGQVVTLVLKVVILFYFRYTISQKFLNSKIFNVFLKNALLLTKPAFIWYKIQQKQ